MHFIWKRNNIMSLFLLSVSLFAGITMLYTMSILLIITSSAEKHDNIYKTLVVANATSLSVLGAMSIAYIMSSLGEFMVGLSMDLINMADNVKNHSNVDNHCHVTLNSTEATKIVNHNFECNINAINKW